jgi:hypothetical protein
MHQFTAVIALVLLIVYGDAKLIVHSPSSIQGEYNCTLYKFVGPKQGSEFDIQIFVSAIF